MSSLIKIEELIVKLKDLQNELDIVIEKANVKYTDALHKENVRLVNEMHDIHKEIEVLRNIPEVGKYANYHLFSDVEPYEIVRVVSEKTLEVRPMKAELKEDFKPEFHIGGFSANCSNQNEQDYIYESDEEAETIKIRKHKNGDWKSSAGGRFNISDKPRKFYD